MKMNFVFLFLMSVTGTYANATCDVAQTARQAVKAFVAIEDRKGITAYFGSVNNETPDISNVTVQPGYKETKDWYIVKVRNKDCRVMGVDLKAENIAIW